jgi:hypothetical protein
MNPDPLVFIASPVSSKSPYIVLQKIEAAARFGAWVQEVERKCPFVAAAHDMAVSKYLSEPKSIDWWRKNISHFMSSAESFYVLCLDGWENSGGVTLETEMARSFNKPIYYYEPMGNSFKRREH